MRGFISVAGRSIAMNFMSGERFTLDTNLLFYSLDFDAGPRHVRAEQIVPRAQAVDCWLTLQSVSEFYAAAMRRRLLPPARAAAIANDWLNLFPTAAPTASAVRSALSIAATGRASYWDALLLATAAEAGCTAILTEDMADGSTLLGVRIINPFAGDSMPAAVEDLLLVE